MFSWSVWRNVAPIRHNVVSPGVRDLPQRCVTVSSGDGDRTFLSPASVSHALQALYHPDHLFAIPTSQFPGVLHFLLGLGVRHAIFMDRIKTVLMKKPQADLFGLIRAYGYDGRSLMEGVEEEGIMGRVWLGEGPFVDYNKNCCIWVFLKEMVPTFI